MSVPWWVYLISLPMLLFGIGLHFIPVLARRLAESDARRREELIAQGLIQENREPSAFGG
ncbi:MAG: hypothetical protein ACLP1W_00465 [Rhodomicrobium sp.]